MAAYITVPAYFLLITFYLAFGSKISDLRMCADKNCEETISHATAVLKFDKKDPNFLKFKGGDMIQIKSKSAGSRPDLWGGQTLDGRRGFFPKAFVKEHKIEVHSPEYIVPTEDQSIEKRLGLKNVSPPKNQQSPGSVGDQGGGRNTGEDDTELDDTEIPDESDDEQIDASPPADDQTANSAQQDERKKEEHQQAKSDDEDSDVDETELDEDEEKEEQKQTQPDSQSESLSQTESKKPEADGKTDDDDDDDDDQESEDDTEFDKDDIETEVPDIPNVLEDDDFLLGLEDLDRNFFDLHENFDEIEDLRNEDRQPETNKKDEATHSTDKAESQSRKQEQEEDIFFKQEEEKVPVPSQQEHQQPPEQQQDLLTKQQEEQRQQQEKQKQQQEEQKQQQEVQKQQQEEQKQQQEEQKQQQEERKQRQEEQKQQQGEQKQQQGDPGNADALKPPGDFDQLKTDAETLIFQPHQHQDSKQQQQQQQTDQPHIDLQKQLDILSQHVEHQQKQVEPNVHQQTDPKQQPQTNPNQQQQNIDPYQLHHDVESVKQVDPNQQRQQLQDQGIHQEQPHQHQEESHQHHLDPHQQQEQQTDGHRQPVVGHLPLPVLTNEPPSGITELPPVNIEPPPSVDINAMDPARDGHQQSSQTVDLPPPEADVIDSKPAVEKQTGSEGIGTMEEIVKSDAPALGEQQVEKEEQQQQQNFDPTQSQVKQPMEPHDIVFTPGDVPAASEPGLSSSMQEQIPVTESVPTPNLDVQATHAQNQPPTDTKPVVETREQQLKETVIDGTTIPLFDDMEVDNGLTSPQDMASSSSSVEATQVKPTETHYTPQITDLPFADEPPGFQYTQDELPKGGSQEGKNEMKTEEVNKEDQEKEKETEEKSKVEREEENSIVDLPVNNSQESKESDINIDPTVDQMYHSDDFISRKPLSVGQGHPPANQGHPPANQGQGPRGDDKPPVEASKANEIPEISSGFDTTTAQPDFRDIPPPPADTTTKAADNTDPAQVRSEAAPSDDPYETGIHKSRHFSEDKLEEEVTGGQGMMGRIESSMKSIIIKLPPSVQSLLEQEPLGLSPTLCVLVTIATLISLITISVCGCLCGGGKKVNKKDPLVVVREIEEKLFIATKEKENLEDELQKIRNEKTQLEKNLRSNESNSGNIKTDLQNVQLHNEALKQQITTLQEQVDELSGQLSSNKSNNQSKDKQLKDLHKQISKLEEKNKKAEEQLETKTREVKDKAEDMKTLTGQIKSLTQQVKQLETSKQQLLSEADDWKEKMEDLNERLRQNEDEMKQMQETVAFKDNEMEVLKDCFRQLKILQGDDESEGSFDQAEVEEKIQKMMDVSRVNASLCAVEDERDSLANRLQIETDARKEVEDQLAKSQREMDTLQTDKMKADRQCQEAQTKLSVLSNYFKEKEAQLQRELGEHEALKKQNVNKLENIDEHAKMMEEEVEMYKTQIDGLKRELASSERDFRSQIAANEKKAHENWLAARAAERELKEVRHDAGVLRQRLTDLERRQNMGPGGLIRPLPTRGMPPPGMMNGPPPPPGMERSPSRGSIPPPHLRDDEFRRSPHERLPPPPDRRPPPPGARLPPHGPPDGRSPPPGDRMPPPGGRLPPPGPEGRSPPPFDRRPHPMDRRTPPYRPPHPDMMSSPRGPPMFGASSPPPRMPPPHGMDPRLGPRTSSPQVRPPPPGREGRPPRQHSQV